MVVDVLYNNIKVNHVLFDKNQSLIQQFYKIAGQYKNEIIVWYHVNLKDCINKEHIKENFKNHMIWTFFGEPYLTEKIGYIEDSPFLKINKAVKYPTWLMSSQCGTIYAEELLKFKELVKDNSLDHALNSIAKLGMKQGLWCYSVPEIIKISMSFSCTQTTELGLFKFVAQHYKKRWLVLLFLNILIYEKRFAFFSFVASLFYKQRKIDVLFQPQIVVTEIQNLQPSLDVVIPTMGREQYLYDVLVDLKHQSFLPKNVIIIEQNPDLNSVSKLDYLQNESWPFTVVHKFIHRTGACNARNIAAELIESDYVFLADDDIRIADKKLLYQSLSLMKGLEINVLNLSCLQENEVDSNKHMRQWSAFGSGCSILNADVFNSLKFNLAYEHGYGEDVDFGMQLRITGKDIIYAPQFRLLHLKAPMGGFRSIKPLRSVKIAEDLTPKPAPTVMLFRKLHHTKCQLLGYKTVLCLKFYKLQSIKNPISYVKLFKKRWNISELCAKELINNKSLL